MIRLESQWGLRDSKGLSSYVSVRRPGEGFDQGYEFNEEKSEKGVLSLLSSEEGPSGGSDGD